ncbi:MAG: histidinol dehydrogenase [Omnitrophica WOR_2 bacterium RIFCSPLOWO2_02_FULL_63_16]|nr:MAG: histidinol dehydrogenase [Omnitrophica WOR_2 bacterium GWF2_63_9]OGX36070.1 MAG: histidinol dehydrogenase [Omnitrophica WOR_2 bacterium RIFCSPHIGHO2_02_FULL_63_39]OGX44115.1 MAG: histidinol dehydrogenase [Omnitrophica WOR_2 bacterium RIFCSPLOWO2_02_FULL_63_16]OGX49022.1 MAG: histidinol dehydrogenase [Omnitrophica WOR_2 bacterium RIFCSPLOWO2_12_FULL_63_16]
MMKIISTAGKTWQQLCARQLTRKRRVEDRVRVIIEDVRLHGDEAVLRYTRRFDRVRLKPKQVRVTETETSAAFQHIDPNLSVHLKAAIQNVQAFYSKARVKPTRLVHDDGVLLADKFDPLNRVGIYIPGGTASLVSTVYMTVIPARQAGVKEIVLTTPPRPNGSIDPNILVVASLLRVDEIYKLGGAQAIAAMALGTKLVRKVDKVVGPGNAYVAEAKRQLFGFVDVDTIAGPSEIAIIANHHSNPQYVVADLLGETEHAGGLGFLITTSKSLAALVKKQIPGGYCLIVRNLEEAVEAANQLAPEHLEIMVKSPRKLLKRIRAAGAIFLGPYSPVTVGDYIAGPSHVLPTGGSARTFSGLGVEDFIRKTHIIAYTKSALEKVREPIERLTALEGLPRHYDAVKVRLE